MLCYNLSGIADCPTRIENKSSTGIDNICIGILKINNYNISSLFNGLSEHDAQLIMIKDINFQMHNYHIDTIRNINKYSMIEFQIQFSYEPWDDFFVMIIRNMLIPFLIHV
jgi:tyrosine-protein phosphatase YwqE